MQKAGADPGLTCRILIYTGSYAFRTNDGIEVWPLATFHKTRAEDRPWP